MKENNKGSFVKVILRSEAKGEGPKNLHRDSSRFGLRPFALGMTIVLLLCAFSPARGEDPSLVRIQTAVNRLTDAAGAFGREINLQSISDHLELRLDESFFSGIWNGISAAARKWTRSEEYKTAENAFLARQHELLAIVDEILADPETSNEEKREIYLFFDKAVSGNGVWSADPSGEGLRRTLNEAYEKTLAAWRRIDTETKEYDPKLLRSLEQIVQRAKHLLDTYGFIMRETESLKKAQKSAVTNAIAFIEGEGQMLEGAIESFNHFLKQLRKDARWLRQELQLRAGEIKNVDAAEEVLVKIVNPIVEQFEGVEEIPSGFLRQCLAALAFNHRSLKLQIEATLQGSPLYRFWSGENASEEEMLNLHLQSREQSESANFAMTLATISLNQTKTPISGSHIFEGLRLDPKAMEAILGVEEGIGGMANFMLTISSLVGNGELLEAGKKLLWAPLSIFLPFWGITDEAAQAHLNQVALFGVARLSEVTGGWAGVNPEEVIQITDADIEQLRQNEHYNIPEDEFNPYRLSVALLSGGVALKVILKPVSLLRHGVIETVIYRIVKKRIGEGRFAAEIRAFTLEEIRSMSSNQILELVGLHVRTPKTGRLTLTNWKFLAEKIRAELIRLCEERLTLRESLDHAIRNIERIAPMTKEMEAQEAQLKSLLEPLQREAGAASLSHWTRLRQRIGGFFTRSRRLSHQQIVNHVMERGTNLEAWKENLLERGSKGEKIPLEELMAFTLACEPKFGPLFGRTAAWVRFRIVAAHLLPQKYPQVFRDFWFRTLRILLPETKIQDITSLTEALYPIPESAREVLGNAPARLSFWRRGPRQFARDRVIQEAQTQLLRLWLMEGLKRVGIDFRSLLREQAESLRARGSLSRAEKRTLQNIEQFLELSRRYEEAFRNTDLDIFTEDAIFEKALDFNRLESHLRDFGSEWWTRHFRFVAWGALTAILFDLIESLEERSLDEQQYVIEHPDYWEAPAGEKIVIETRRFSEERKESERFIDELEEVTPYFLRGLIQHLERELSEEPDPLKREKIEEDLRWCRKELESF